MKSILEMINKPSYDVNEVKNTDDNKNSVIEVLKYRLNEQIRTSIDINGLIIDEYLMKRLAGDIIENAIAYTLNIPTNEIVRNKFYDFEYKGQLIEVKAYNKRKKDIIYRQSQKDNKDKLIFVLAKYSINGDTYIIDKIDVVSGSDIDFVNVRNRSNENILDEDK